MDISNFKYKMIILAGFSLVLAGCSDSDPSLPDPVDFPPPPPPVIYSYDVEVVNLTFSQPMSPVAVIAHDDSYNLFEVGTVASLGLEELAEGGDNSTLISEAESSDVYDTRSGGGILPPTGSETISFRVTESQASTTYLSLVTMLVNTNDAITAARNIDVSGLAVGDSMSFTTLSYDSGTEANSEAAGTIPGPADGGEGFNPVRDDIADQITLHNGVITSDDGLISSVLTESHRWDNPVLRVTISRVE